MIEKRNRRLAFWAESLILIWIGLLGAGHVFSSSASASETIDWSAWKSLPVFERGRVMPLDTYARRTVKKICGRENPRLAPAEGDSEASKVLFPDGRPRKFSAAELLFSWTVAPELWSDVPFLVGSNETLRKDWLEIPLYAADGRRLKRVSPSQLERGRAAAEKLDELARRQRQAQAENRPFEIDRAEESLANLNDAYSLFRKVAYQPKTELEANEEFVRRLMAVLSVWRRELQPVLAPWLGTASAGELKTQIEATDAALKELTTVMQQGRMTWEPVAGSVDRLCEATGAIAQFFEGLRHKIFEADDENQAQLEQGRAMVNRLATTTSDLARKADRLRRSLYETDASIRVVPRLDRMALLESHDADTAGSPWLGLGVLLDGTETTLASYQPKDKDIQEVRKAFAEVKAVYLEEKSTDRAGRFNEAMRRLVESIRRLGVEVDAERQKIIDEAEVADPQAVEIDDPFLEKTAYPASGAMSDELLYNRADPFLWSWVATLAALVFFALAFGVVRLPCFFLGIFLLAIGQGVTCWGLWLRASITGMVPVTNMYETILFTGAVVGVMALWFGLLPLFRNGLSAAWQATAIPRTSEGAPMSEPILALIGPDRWSATRTVLIAVRGLLVVAILVVFAFGSLSPKGGSILSSLFPLTVTGGLKGISGVVVLWVVGLAILLWTLWFFPRVIPTLGWAVVLVVRDWRQRGMAQPIQKTLDAKAYLVAGAAVAGICYLVAYFTPGTIFQREVGTGMAAVLRNNFWLALHVLTITASYGAGALAWGLGNLSLCYYAFGRYRSVSATASKETRPKETVHSVVKNLPPKACLTLSGYIYRAVQVAVLMLAVGTITGAIWADYAWGRYWGWDPKEVWALVTLLVYLAVLHGRWAGWAGAFGMAVGAVCGATSILIAWYGVNFMLGAGLHSYGFGAGGKGPVLLCVAANWLLVGVAAIRYFFEGKGPSSETSS